MKLPACTLRDPISMNFAGAHAETVTVASVALRARVARMASNNCSCDASMMDQLSRMMTFHFGHTLILLFESWHISSPGELVGAIVAVFIMAILYEGLKTLREYLLFLDVKRMSPRPAESIQQSDKTHLILEEPHSRPSKGLKHYSISITMHLLQSALHVVQVGLGYILMLVAMSFNGWLFLAISFGAGVGYLLFAKTRHLMGNFREQNDVCH